MLSLASPPKLTPSDALAASFELPRDRIFGKSDKQIHRWRQDRERGVANFNDAVAEKGVEDITRADAPADCARWQDRVDAGKVRAETANKDFGHLLDMFRTVSDLRGLNLETPFDKLRWKAQPPRRGRPATLQRLDTNATARTRRARRDEGRGARCLSDDGHHRRLPVRNPGCASGRVGR